MDLLLSAYPKLAGGHRDHDGCPPKRTWFLPPHYHRAGNLPALVQHIGSWNEMIAALAGKLKDVLGDGPLGVQSAITHYPNFEQLEAAGQDKLPPGCEHLASLIQRVGLEQRDRTNVPVGPSGPLAGKQNPCSGPIV